MFVPDEARVRAARVLTFPAFMLYTFYCQWRDHRTGYSSKGLKAALKEGMFSRAALYKAHSALLANDFICETEEGRVGLRGGSFEYFDKTPAAAAVWSAPALHVPPIVEPPAENLALEFEAPAPSPMEEICLPPETNSPETSLPPETEILPLETALSPVGEKSLPRETSPYIDPARVLNPPSIPSEKLHDTHTPSRAPAHAREEVPAEAKAARAGVCVSTQISKFGKPELWRYAQGYGLGGGWVTEALRTGRWDYEVEQFLTEEASGRKRKTWADLAAELRRERDKGNSPPAVSRVAGGTG